MYHHGDSESRVQAKSCLTCGSAFIPKRAEQKYCSRPCRRNGIPRRPLAERFWEKVAITRGCWLWTGRPRNAYGYGRLRLGGEHDPTTNAHRVAWLLANGPIPEGLWVLHRCDNARCVRPDHLFLGTPADNIHDMDRKGRRVVWNKGLRKNA